MKCARAAVNCMRSLNQRRGLTAISAYARSACLNMKGRFRLCCMRSRCNCSLTTPRARAARTLTNREIWRNPSQWNGSSAFFSEIAQGTSAKTVCTIRQARSDAVQAAENALDRQANGARILTNQIRAAQHLLALIREQFKL